VRFTGHKKSITSSRLLKTMKTDQELYFGYNNTLGKEEPEAQRL
jgi:hypothetical protein